ncbi:hypothetical protein AZE42_11839, partial [Rhizopogon vesiculosus]
MPPLKNSRTIKPVSSALRPEDRLLNIGCGWGMVTLATYAARNYRCDVTGITLGKNQTKFGNECIKTNGVTPKIVSLNNNNGIFVLQVAGIHPSWQYEDLIWC